MFFLSADLGDFFLGEFDSLPRAILLFDTDSLDLVGVDFLAEGAEITYSSSDYLSLSEVDFFFKGTGSIISLSGYT